MHRPPAATLSEISELTRCSAVFLPADPARTGKVAFWHSDGSGPRAGEGLEERLFERDSGAPGHPAAVGFPTGTRVRHSEWGDGMVLGEEGDRITVLFDSVGYRTLSLAAITDQGLLTVIAKPAG